MTTLLGLSDVSGWLGAGVTQHEDVGVPGYLGVVRGAPVAPAPRTIIVEGLVQPATLADRIALVSTLHTTFLRTGWLETDDRPGVRTRVRGVDVQFATIPGAPKLGLPALRVQLAFVALDGGSEDVVSAPPLLVGATPVPVPCGTLPTSGMLLVWGGTSPLSITYTPANGVGATTLVVTGALATHEHYALDLDFATAWKVAVDGSRTRHGDVTGTWPALDPAHRAGAMGANGVLTVGAQLAVSSGTGLLVYRRRWRI